MADDAATGSAVLSTGAGLTGSSSEKTWTWDGTTWAKQVRRVHPPFRTGAAMAYDAPTGTVVLFGGFGYPGGTILGDTWTWGRP
jgi:hypothetical protein